MSGLKRMSISISEEMENKIVEMRKTDKFCRCSYTEIIRQLLEAGVKKFEADKEVEWYDNRHSNYRNQRHYRTLRS